MIVYQMKAADLSKPNSFEANSISALKPMDRNEISAKWSKFTAADLSALTSRDDLVAQLVSKYQIETTVAQKDVDSLMMGRHF